MTIDYHARRGRLLELLASRKLDSCVILGVENLRYLSGFTGSSGALVCVGEQVVFLTDSRYTTQARQQVDADDIREYARPVEGIIGCLGDLGGERIGFEGTLSYQQVENLQKQSRSGWFWQSLGEAPAALRVSKEPAEVALIADAARLNAEAFEDIRPLIRPGRRERDIALELEFALKRRGAEEKAFDFIVASGERGAMPHGVAGDRLLANHELVTIDFGCRLDGYHSDETVTVALGRPDAQLVDVYEIVREAHDRAIAAVRPGIALAELDRLARDIIAEAGYGDFFGHGLGHGVGLDVHEQPTVSPRSKETAAEGMVITIEPGIYLPGKGGVRIEDMVLVTADGVRQLTSLSKEFSSL